MEETDAERERFGVMPRSSTGGRRASIEFVSDRNDFGDASLKDTERPLRRSRICLENCYA